VIGFIYFALTILSPSEPLFFIFEFKFLFQLLSLWSYIVALQLTCTCDWPSIHLMGLRKSCEQVKDSYYATVVLQEKYLNTPS